MPNSNTLKIIGTCELPNNLEMGVDHKIIAKVSIPKVEKIDLENGEYEFCHKGRLLNIELTTNEGKSFKARVKGSKSQKLRWAIMEFGDADYYEQAMDKIIANLETILNIK